jgi:hypothetical protein
VLVVGAVAAPAAANVPAAAGPAVGASKPTTLAPGGRLGTAIPLILVALFTLGLVFAPAAAWRYLATRSPA